MFNVTTRYGCFTSERLLHFLSRGYTPACLKVRFRYVALSPGPVDGWRRASMVRGDTRHDDVLLMMMAIMMIHLDQTLAAYIK
jgi:hypothetical protein